MQIESEEKKLKRKDKRELNEFLPFSLFYFN